MKELEALIDQLSVTSQKSKAEIIADLSEIATLKYGKAFTDNQRQLIENIQRKLITSLYKRSGHEYVSRRADWKKDFGFDNADMELFEQAARELLNAGILEMGEYYTKLTNEGILKAKEFFGEL